MFIAPVQLGPFTPTRSFSVNDTIDNWGREPAATGDTTPEARPRPARRIAGSEKARVAGALILGGVAGAAILGPISSLAASPAPAASTAPGSGTNGAGRGIGGHNEAVSDTSVVAKAIGISEADLLAALQGGQTVAAVAKAHNVNLQVVIDALVADGQSELDAAVKAGTITQAQADAEKANLLQRATDQANGSFQGGRH